MNYKTIRKEATAQFEEKKSVFIGSAKRVESEEEAKAFINEIKSKYKDARHNVYAYVIGSNCGIQRYSDDGEPQGTGGIPVLEVIKKNEISDVVVVVTRYFGGILLGSSGLCRAYGKGASSVLKEAGIVEKVQGCHLKITIEYDLLGKVQYLFSQSDWDIKDIVYTDKVDIHTLRESHEEEIIRQALMEATANRFIMEKIKEDIYFKESNVLYEII